MTEKQADVLRSSIQDDLNSYLDGKDYNKAYVNMGAKYRMTLEGFDWDKHFSEVIKAEGGIGEKSKQLKNWLIELHQ